MDYEASLPSLPADSDEDAWEMEEETESILDMQEKLREAEDESDQWPAAAASSSDPGLLEGPVHAEMSAAVSGPQSSEVSGVPVLPVESSEPPKRP